MAEYELPLPTVDVTKYVDGELVESYRHPKDSKASSSPGTNQNATRAYTFDNYQDDTATTAIYPGAGIGNTEAVTYTILGLIGEGGEIANRWKKFYRDYPDLDITIEEYDSRIFSIKSDILKELGDVLWYSARLAEEFDVKLSDVAAENIRKLQDRKQRDKLHGSGDDR